MLRGTLRTLDADTRARLVERIRAVLMGTAAAHGVSGIVDQRGYPCLVNDESACALARAAAASVVGASTWLPHPTMGGEDMAYYLQVVPGCYLWLGSASSADGAGVPPPARASSLTSAPSASAWRSWCAWHASS